MGRQAWTQTPSVAVEPRLCSALVCCPNWRRSAKVPFPRSSSRCSAKQDASSFTLLTKPRLLRRRASPPFKECPSILQLQGLGLVPILHHDQGRNGRPEEEARGGRTSQTNGRRPGQVSSHPGPGCC